MAYLKFLIYLFLYSSVLIVKGDECVTYDFENDVDNHFVNDKGMCAQRPLQVWNVGSYTDIKINNPHPVSKTHISAPLTLGCGSTFDFTMTGSGTITSAPSGTIEAKVYLDFNSTFGYIMMEVMIVRPDGNDLSVAEASIASYDNNVVSGWQTLKIDRIGFFGTHRGYVTFLGRGSENSYILVDSFRYIPPAMDEELCVVYKDGLETTTETNTETTAATSIETTAATVTENTQYTTTEQNEDIEKCVTYNFESDYDVLFSNDNHLCNDFLPWELKNYTAIGLESPNFGSSVFITPHEVISCISSIVFKMDSGGIIEAKVFMESVQDMDHIIIQAYEVTDKEHDTVAGFKIYHQENESFVFGWNIISFTLLDIPTFDGYLVFIGSADKNSTVLVDSVRYIPPRTPPEHASCNVY